MNMQNNHVPLRINEQIVLQYLLGELPEIWQAYFEELLFTDPDCCALLEVVEENLIEDYVSDELSAERRNRFETCYLVSQPRRQKVAFACALKQALADLSAPAHPDPRRWRPRLSFWRTRPALRYTFAGLTLSILIGCAWIAVVMTRFRAQQAGPQTELATHVRREQADQPTQQSQPTDIASTPRGQVPQSGASGELSPKPDTSPHNQSAIITKTLKPGRLRDIEPQPEERMRANLLSISSATRLIRLQLELESKTTFPTYRATLMTAEGQSIRLPENLRLTPSGNGRTIVVELPAVLPRAGDYVLTLLGVDDGGGAEEIGDYYFTVLKQ